MHCTDCLYHVSFRRYRPVKLPLSCEVVEKKVVFWPPICRGRFWICIFKSQSLPSMWPVLVEFCSASLEGTIDEKERKKESVVKRKSVDNYVERPKK